MKGPSKSGRAPRTLPLIMHIRRTEYAGILEVSSESMGGVWYQVDLCSGVCSCLSRQYPCKHLRVATCPVPRASSDQDAQCYICTISPATHQGVCRACYFGTLSVHVPVLTGQGDAVVPRLATQIQQ